MNNFKKGLLGVTVGSLISGSVMATDIRIDVTDIDVGTNSAFTTNPDGVTDFFSSMTFDKFKPKSTYFDMNVLNPTGNASGIGNGDLALDVASDIFIGSLNTFGFGGDSELYPNQWAVFASWELYGVSGLNEFGSTGADVNGVFDVANEAIGAQFVGGFLDLEIANADDGEKYDLFRIAVDGSNVVALSDTGANVKLNGHVVDGSIVNDALSLDINGVPSFQDFLDADVENTIRGLVDANVYGADQLLASDASFSSTSISSEFTGFLAANGITGAGVDALLGTAQSRTSTESISADLSFDVPEPTSLALLGLGLLGFGAAKRRKA